MRFACNQQLRQRANDAHPCAFAQLDQRVEAVLRLQRIAHTGGLQGDLANAPARIARQKIVEIDRLMRTMERPRAEMDDTRFDPRRGVTGAGNCCRKGVKICPGQGNKLRDGFDLMECPAHGCYGNRCQSRRVLIFTLPQNADES